MEVVWIFYERENDKSKFFLIKWEKIFFVYDSGFKFNIFK